MTPEERFERIESNLEQTSDRLHRITERMDRITEAHLELETAQKNTTVLLNRFIEETHERGKDIDDRIANLTILVDRLVAKDLGRNGGESGG